MRTVRTLLPALYVISLVGGADGEPKGARPESGNYGSMVREWHTPRSESTSQGTDSARPTLRLRQINTTEALEIDLTGGDLAARDAERVAHFFREPSSKNEHPIEPRLVRLLANIQHHFGAQEIRVLSGYRTPGRSASNHGRGRAADFVVPGVSDAKLVEYCRALGFVGVGLYTKSGFVHLDVRAASYFWIDASAPGKRNRERAVLLNLAALADRDARTKGERPTDPWRLLHLDLWAKQHGSPTPESPPEESGEDDRDEP